METNLILTDADKLLLRSRPEVGYITADHDVGFYLCPCCATTFFGYSRPGTGQTVATLGRPCVKCETFQAKHPEVFAWVNRCFAAHDFIKNRLP